MFDQIDYLDSVESTNDYLKAFIPEAVPRVAVAEEQTAGKGQYGRSWLSTRGEGLFVSYLFFPQWDSAGAGLLNVISSLAVVETIRRLASRSLPLCVKRPNDIMLSGRKVCGILSELASRGPRIQWAIVGMGVNLHQEAFPEELQDRAISLQMAGVSIPDRREFLGVLTRELERRIAEIDAGGAASALKQYNREAQ